MSNATPTYCSLEDAASIRGKPDTGIYSPWWLLAVDELIESHTGQGYKGRERTVAIQGTGNELLRLPSRAATAGVTAIYESSRLMSPSEWTLDIRGRLLRRAGPAWPGAAAGGWVKGMLYTVTYTEPSLDECPLEYRLVAADAVAKIAMFAKKHKEFDMALTASDGASAGKVATQSATSFPASLLVEIKKSIETIRKRNI